MLKLGVFGVGHLGKFHLNNWKNIEGVEIVGFYDPSDKNAQEVEEKYGLKRFAEAEELIRLVDAADVVAPTTFHHELCKLALRNGKHVFVEKPMADTMEQAMERAGIVRMGYSRIVVLDEAALRGCTADPPVPVSHPPPSAR